MRWHNKTHSIVKCIYSIVACARLRPLDAREHTYTFFISFCLAQQWDAIIFTVLFDTLLSEIIVFYLITIRLQKYISFKSLLISLRRSISKQCNHSSSPIAHNAHSSRTQMTCVLWCTVVGVGWCLFAVCHTFTDTTHNRAAYLKNIQPQRPDSVGMCAENQTMSVAANQLRGKFPEVYNTTFITVQWELYIRLSLTHIRY